MNGKNAYVEKDKYSILFSKEGMEITRPHRVSLSEDPQGEGFVDNFSGTLAHEITHAGREYTKLFDDIKFNRDFVVEWQVKFGWKLVERALSEDSNIEWEKNAAGQWQNGDYIVLGDSFTSMPEKCIGGKNSYASSIAYYEDICDSVAAFLLNPAALNEEKRKFLEDKINEYHLKTKKDE